MKVLSEKKIVQNFKKKMRVELEVFKYKEQIQILPNIIDFAYYDYSKNSLIGIEFKKYDWKKVIYQANLISGKFNETYVCLIRPKSETIFNNIIETCKKLNIGVIFYNINSKEFEWQLLSKVNENITQIIYKKNLTLEQYFRRLKNVK